MHTVNLQIVAMGASAHGILCVFVCTHMHMHIHHIKRKHNHKGQAQWHTFVTHTLWQLTPEDLEFESSLGHIGYSVYKKHGVRP